MLRRSRRPTLPAVASRRRSAKLALPRGPHGVETSTLARRELAKLVVGLLGELEDVVGDGHHALVVFVKDGEEVVRVDAGAGSVGDAKSATAVARLGWGEGVDVEETLALVVRSRRLDDHDSALDECDSNGTVAQHSGIGWDE